MFPHREHVLQSWLQEVSQLFLRDQLEQGRLERVFAYIVIELHRVGSSKDAMLWRERVAAHRAAA